ncbi:hypothetical protein MRB53_041611 [Persea americana]|nr:hypothetical protein MRB53_041611 [Persea americana]
MTTNGHATAVDAFAPVLSALATLQANVDRAQKAQAHEYLEQFQKSSADATSDAKLFAATTLKGKILASFSNGPKPIRVQLCVCLANLAIQMLEWKDVLPHIVSTLGSDAQGIPCMLDFLRVLPEEVTQGRKINLSEDDLLMRTDELLVENATQVLALLIQYTKSSGRILRHLAPSTNGSIGAAARNPQMLECLTSWLREIPMADVIASPLLDTVVAALADDTTFDAAVASDEKDSEVLKGITRVLAEAGEAWVVLMARMPEQFRPLTESILECAARDQELDAISLTFNFWNQLVQYITLDKYIEARLQYVDIYSNLVDVMIRNLEFPKPEGGGHDLFDGDREAEEKFREFRHLMGDVLKDACEVVGVSECLRKTFDRIQAWVTENGAQAAQGKVPDWQALEAPLFSMRAMGRMVPNDESVMLPQLMPLLIQIPDHEKRSSGRAALSFKFFCNDCADLLKGYATQLQEFYEQVLGKLGPASQEEVTEGVASVLARQAPDEIYTSMKLFCDPVLKRSMALAQKAQDDRGKEALADSLQLITLFIQWVQPHIELGKPHPAVQYCQEIFPVLAKICDAFSTSVPVLERLNRCWRSMITSYRSALAPLIPALADKLANGFASTRQGCFLFTSNALIREFSFGAEGVDNAMSASVYHFFELQTTSFLRALSDLTPEELPDDGLAHHSQQFLASNLVQPVLQAASTALTLLKEDPLIATLHFLRDFLGYGDMHPPTSTHFDRPDYIPENPESVRSAVKTLLLGEGETITQRVLTGMMYSFPRDCLPDASGVLLGLFQLIPTETAAWIQGTIALLPAGSVTPQEAERLLGSIKRSVQS